MRDRCAPRFPTRSSAAWPPTCSPGRYAPGERLPTQRALAAELGVNMASVREGIKRLEQLQLVEVRHGDAMRVRDWRAHGGLDVLVHALGGGAALDAR